MKKHKLIFWTSTIIIALMEAVMPICTWIFAPEYLTIGTQALSYPDYFTYAVIVAKVLGVTAIIYPKTPSIMREWAYAGLTFNFIFAFISHFAVDRVLSYMLMPLAFLGILMISYIYQKKLLKPRT